MDKDKEKEEDDLFVTKRELGELFDSTFPLNVNLWRGDNPHNNDSIFFPILKSFLLSSGKPRNPDIKTYKKGNEIWVDSKGGGISLFDKPGIPSKKWDYYKLIAGTEIPHGLVITKDEWKDNLKAFHYTIRPQWDMPLANFCKLLDRLAIKLVKE